MKNGIFERHWNTKAITELIYTVICSKMKMSKVDDILQNLILSKETIFSEVSSLPVKSRLIMLLKQVVKKCRNSRTTKNMFNEITLKCTKRQARASWYFQVVKPLLDIVWKLLKMSHLNFWILAFSTNFCHIEIDRSGNTVWLQASGFQKLAKLDHFWHF